jgi:hypothetical protein
MRRTTLALVSLLLSVPAFLGCGGGGVTGTYVHEEQMPDGNSMRMALQLKGGNKAVMSLKGGPGQELPSVEGTYSVAGDQVTVVMDGDTDVYTLKDGHLTSGATDFFGETLVLKKQ